MSSPPLDQVLLTTRDTKRRMSLTKEKGTQREGEYANAFLSFPDRSSFFLGEYFFRSPDRKQGLSDVRRTSSRIKQFRLSEAIVYSYVRDMLFVLLTCLLIDWIRSLVVLCTGSTAQTTGSDPRPQPPLPRYVG